ncbi:MAG: 23S rRNA pseudouridine synthase [Parcubacteria group bacterium Greene0714_21]|nr:MAG: 23S rRNA pseudouridine synthase [Parcubacteria group bacterium Greene0416_39]TSD04062.1 MAG: 23S rRNA pseudouridine synthase [Parcubacteria group bacterium Greene0714_21]
MNLKILYEDDTLLVVDKPAGIDIEGIKNALPKGSFPAHRLDKDTSGVLLVAKNPETLDFLQKQFQQRKVEKKYVCLVEGNVKENKGTIETLVGRSKGDKRKQKVYLAGEPGSEGKREAISSFEVLQRFEKYTLLEVTPKTGRKHQIRAHLAHIGHPIAGDKLYAFKGQSIPQGLKRQFLHATFLKIGMRDGSKKEFKSELPQDLQKVLENLVSRNTQNYDH